MTQPSKNKLPPKIARFFKLIMLFNFSLLFYIIISGNFGSLFNLFFGGPYGYIVDGFKGYLIITLVISVTIQFLTSLAAMFKYKSGLLTFSSISVLVPTIIGAGLVKIIEGAAWGRPLRVNGKQIHPELCEGKGWAKGAKPDASGLHQATRIALETLWLHDAQKEHASVPAFSRISWLLAAVGAPAALMEWAQRSGMEEIEHTRLCLALAAGYGGRTHTVKPMPELLSGGLDTGDDAMITLATESLQDGCQLEDFNADVAAACAKVCEEPVTRTVLEQIALEERSHANFSWALLTWTLESEPLKIRKAITKALAELADYERPTAVSWDKKHLVEQANQEQLLRHGRIPDEQWQELWDMRLTQTKHRLQQMLTEKQAA